MQRILFEKPHIDELKKQRYALIDMHVHSDYSCDGSASINSIINKAKKLGIGVAITDHNKIEGSIKAIKNKKGVFVIPGLELRSKEGIDLLLYFKKISELKHFYDTYVVPNKKRNLQGSSKLNIFEIIALSKKYSCLLCLAHPYRFYIKKLYSIFKGKRTKKLLKLFKTIEVINGKSLTRKNKRAIKKVSRMHKHFIGGSDAHRLKDVGIVLTAVKNAKTARHFLEGIVKNESKVIGKETKIRSKIIYPFLTVRNVLKSKLK